MTQNPKIYRIDKTHRQLKSLNQTAHIIEKIITISLKRLKNNSTFQAHKLSQSQKDQFTYYLYIFDSNETASDWKQFLPSSLTANQDFNHKRLSLLLFIETEYELYCLVGGNSYQLIIPFIDHFFGLNIYSRIIEPKYDELSSIKYRGITGRKAGIDEQYRNDFRIMDFIKFGKIPQSIHLTLSEKISELHFSFLLNSNEKHLKISVDKALKIKKRVNFEDLHKIIVELGYINELVPKDYLSSYKQIGDKEFISRFLRPELVNNIYNDIPNVLGKASSRIFEHDFCNPNNMAVFFEADEYKIKEKTEKKGYSTFKTTDDRNKIYNFAVKRAVELYGDNDPFNFQTFLQGIRVTSHQNNIQTGASSFLFHISTELTVSGKQYFLIDNNWYELRDSFIKDLKVNTEHVLKSYKSSYNLLYKPWIKAITRTEGEYNMLYNSEESYIVIDTIISDGIELCDIIKYDKDNLFLLHVKHGFNTNMRDLTNQILISAKRLKDNIGSDNSLFLEKIYEKLEAKGRYINLLSKKEFTELFNKKITFVLGFTSHLKDDLDIYENLNMYRSNIARFSLVQCSSQMRSEYYDLLTIQIKKL